MKNAVSWDVTPCGCVTSQKTAFFSLSSICKEQSESRRRSHDFSYNFVNCTPAWLSQYSDNTDTVSRRASGRRILMFFVKCTPTWLSQYSDNTDTVSRRALGRRILLFIAYRKFSLKTYIRRGLGMKLTTHLHVASILRTRATVSSVPFISSRLGLKVAYLSTSSAQELNGVDDRMINGRGANNWRRNPVPGPPCSPQIPYE
jgi:hypothetical protein